MANHNRLLELALKGLEAERQRIDEEVADLIKQMNGRIRASSGVPAPFRAESTGGLTAAGRKALSDAMKRRWAVKKRAKK
jgi:hypothetical protein